MNEVFEDPLRANEELSLPPDQEVPPAAAEPPAPVSAEEQQVGTIRAYRERVLNHPDLLLASLGSHNAGLLLIGHELEQAILQVLASGDDTAARVSKALPAVDSYLRLSKQVERNAQLALRSVEQRRKWAQKEPSGTLRQAPPFTGDVAWPSEEKLI